MRLADYRLIAFDMDSTLINIECIDELAEVAGCREQVAAITAATMRRVAQLAGLPVAALSRVYEQRLQLNPGAHDLLAACRSAGLTTVLVSGGFSYFADKVAASLSIDHVRSNVLQIEAGVLTGRLVEQGWGDICDGAEKRRKLLQTCDSLGVTAAQAIAVGDGANDLPMMEACNEAGGLSVAYYAKPAVRERAKIVIETGGLDRLLDWFS